MITRSKSVGLIPSFRGTGIDSASFIRSKTEPLAVVSAALIQESRIPCEQVYSCHSFVLMAISSTDSGFDAGMSQAGTIRMRTTIPANSTSVCVTTTAGVSS